MKYLSDTSPDADRVLTECYNRMTPARKIALVEHSIRFGRALHASGFRSRHPGATDAEIWVDWVRMTLGDEMARRAKESWPMSANPPEVVRVTREVMEALGHVGSAAALGGSFASSIYGRSRQTQDAD